MKQTTRKLLAATLLLSSSIAGIPAAMAQLTAAGTTISNTATATYSDGTNNYNATSNTVEVKVAEVPGVNVTAQTPSNSNPTAGDTLYVEFVITNVGNDSTQFFIPGTARLTNATDFSVSGPIQIVKVGTTAITPVNVPADGSNNETGSLLGAQGAIPVNGTITVRVPIKVSGTATSTSTTTVELGNTATPNAQNVDRTPDPDSNDVRTVDNADSVSGETQGVITQQSEAMATSSAISVNARLQAFATILKAASDYTNSNTPSVLTDDILTYSLALKVDSSTTVAGLAASDLHPTVLNLEGGTANESHILVSDAIPDKTELSSANPTAPTGWTVVYSVSPTSVPAHRANWTRTRPTSGTITRVGFIRATAVTKGSAVTGFSFSVNPLSTFKGGQIANIAQVFGQSQPGTPVPGTSTQIVYDESGDQAANNQLKGGNPDPTTTGGAPETGLGIGNGVADTSKDGTDSGTGKNPTDATTTNQGVEDDADGGEDNIFTIAATPLNGPNGQPGAINTTNNDDFTNKSIQLPANTNPADALTDDQTPATDFINTVRNTSDNPQTISLIPKAPTNPGDLPVGTIVKIEAGGEVAIYRYDGTKFDFQPTGSTGTGAGDPPKLVDVPKGGDVNYKVTIDLPDGVGQLKEFSVPIEAFVDTNNDGLPANEPANTTINRLYTGYVRLLKDARILEGSSIVVDYTQDQTALSAAAKPGRILEYRIRYSNISTDAPDGSNSVDLPANNLIITEDGATLPNNWFGATKDTVGGTIPGSATDPNGAITGTLQASDIKIYIDTIATLNPQGNGTFTFRRLIK